MKIASFENIRRLLKIFEQERNYEVLLTVKNLHDLSCHPSLYSVPIILHPLPSEIVEGEYFVTADLLNLIPSSSSPARDVESEAAGRELVISTQPVQPSSTSEDFSSAPQAYRQGERGSRLERLPLERKGSRPTPRTLKRRKGTLGGQNVPWAGMEDFVPWVPPISSHYPDWGEEEEEDGMFDLIHNFAARKRKRDASFERAADAIPKVVGGSGQSRSNEG